MESNKFSSRHPVLYRTLLALGSTVVPFVIGLAPFFLLLAYADRISGALFAALLVLYVVSLSALAILVMRPKRMNELRAILGDEAFFARFPREKKKELRRWKKVDAYRSENAEHVENMAKEGTIVERVQAEEAWRRRRNKTILLVVCVIVILAAVMILAYDARDRIASWTGYVRATMAERAGNTEEAIDRFSVLGDYKDATARAAKLAHAMQPDDSFINTLRSTQVGDVVTFGHYEQDNRTDDGAEPIDWIVLMKENGRALLLSEFALDEHPYYLEVPPYYDEASLKLTWEDCPLRKWLNDTFYKTAFSESERYMIAKNKLYNGSGEEERPLYSLIMLKKKIQKDTEDKVFLLNGLELYDLAEGSDYLHAAPTEYALAQGVIMLDVDMPAFPDGICDCWTRDGAGMFSGSGVRPAIVILLGD